MESGICLHSVIPVRGEPSHKSEMVTQVLFGELYHVTEKENYWFKIKLLLDGYEGWINTNQTNLIDEQEFTRLANAETSIATDLVQLLLCDTTGAMIPLVLGSSLPGLGEMRFTIGTHDYIYEGQVSETRLNSTNDAQYHGPRERQQLTSDAVLYMNAPYLWGGRSPFGIDCSGFVQMVYKLQGMKLMRDATQQATQGEVVSLLAEAEPGDLAFFDDEDGNITHVGLLLDHNRIIHCSGKVQVDAVDHQGIFNNQLKRYTHKLRLIKRIIPY